MDPEPMTTEERLAYIKRRRIMHYGVQATLTVAILGTFYMLWVAGKHRMERKHALKTDSEKTFMLYDRNKDGRLSRDEFFKYRSDLEKLTE